jgi:hypothetical protein
MITVKNRQQIKLIDDTAWLKKNQLEWLKKSVYHTFRVFIIPSICIKPLKKYFQCGIGRPSKDLQSMIGLFILQHLFDLSDEQTIESYSFNDAFRYALDISRNEYLSRRTYYMYRDKILGKGQLIFDDILDNILKKFEFDHSIQRMDSTVIRTWLKNMNRLEMFSTTIKMFIRTLKNIFPESYNDLSEKIIKKYLPQDDENTWFGKFKPSQYEQALVEAAKDILELIEKFENNQNIASIYEFQLLKRIVKEQIHVEDQQVKVKLRDEYKGSALTNPHDPDAQFNGHKKKAGYKVNVTESCSESKDVDNPNIILQVRILDANTSDQSLLVEAIEKLEEKNVKPKIMLADNGYDSQENEAKLRERGVDLITPPSGDAPDGFGVIDFDADHDNHTINKCPMGQKCLENVVNDEKMKTRSYFDPDKCRQCPHIDDCPVDVRNVSASMQWEWDRIRLEARRIQFQDDPEVKKLFRQRSGGESTFGSVKTHMGMERVSRRGRERVELAVFLTFAGLNILRIHRWIKKQGGSAFKIRDNMQKYVFLSLFLLFLLAILSQTAIWSNFVTGTHKSLMVNLQTRLRIK